MNSTTHLCELNPEYAGRCMARLWDRMHGAFGNQWDSGYGKPGEEQFLQWQETLGKFSPEEIAGALKMMDQWDDKFPPTLPQFAALCRSARNYLKTHRPYQPAPADAPKVEHHRGARVGTPAHLEFVKAAQGLGLLRDVGTDGKVAA